MPTIQAEAPGEARAAAATPDSDVVYVVDADLKLVECSDTWDQFAVANGGVAASAPRPSVLDAFSGAARARWTGIYGKLLAGEIPGYAERFTCPSPTLRRTYQLTISPRRDAADRVVQLVHRTQLLDERPVRYRDRQAGPIRAAIAADDAPAASIRLAGNLRPLDEVGGDLIWERRSEGGRRVVVLADVMGHGDRANRVAHLIEAILDAMPPTSPGAAVRQLNDELVGRLAESYDETIFATGLYLDLDPALGRLRVSNFAHFGLLFSERGIIDPPGGLPIGMFPADEPWPEMELEFADLGRRLMAYTDGIVEQFDAAGAMFGTAGLLQAFLRTLPLDLKASLDEIMVGLDRFRGDALIKDDQSLLAIELAG